MTRLKLALCQTQSKVGTAKVDPRPANWARAQQMIRRAASRGAKLIVFGEMYLVGYRTDEHLFRYALQLNNQDPYIRRMVNTAKRYRVHLIMGTACYSEEPLQDIHNSALLVGPRGLVGVYHKTHVAAFPYDGGRKLATERVFFSPGNDLPVFDTPFGKIGIQICYDIVFPETTRVLALKGAQLVINVSAATETFEEFWDHIVPVRAMENCLWFAMCSVVGVQRDSRLFGGSRIAGPDGTVRHRAKLGQEDFVLCDVDFNEVSHVRGTSHHYNVRNPKLYGPLTEV